MAGADQSVLSQGGGKRGVRGEGHLSHVLHLENAWQEKCVELANVNKR